VQSSDPEEPRGPDCSSWDMEPWDGLACTRAVWVCGCGVTECDLWVLRVL
jgi:hypothetical protein